MKEKLLKGLNWLLNLQNTLTPAADKLAHFYWGLIYAYPVDYVFDNNYLTIGVPLALGISKELRDKQEDENGNKLGNVEWLDIISTTIPGILLAIN